MCREPHLCAMRIVLAACGSAHLRAISRALQDRDALAGLWITDKNTTGITPDKYRRCWLYHLAMKPFYHLAPIGLTARMAMALLPVWGSWIRRQQASFDVAYSIMDHGTELFDRAEQVGAFAAGAFAAAFAAALALPIKPSARIAETAAAVQ